MNHDEWVKAAIESRDLIIKSLSERLEKAEAERDELRKKIDLEDVEIMEVIGVFDRG